MFVDGWMNENNDINKLLDRAKWNSSTVTDDSIMRTPLSVFIILAFSVVQQCDNRRGSVVSIQFQYLRTEKKTHTLDGLIAAGPY